MIQPHLQAVKTAISVTFIGLFGSDFFNFWRISSSAWNRLALVSPVEEAWQLRAFYAAAMLADVVALEILGKDMPPLSSYRGRQRGEEFVAWGIGCGAALGFDLTVQWRVTRLANAYFFALRPAADVAITAVGAFAGFWFAKCFGALWDRRRDAPILQNPV
jgi:hypothetical protein